MKNKAFTLVELLVVISILAIISVVAYQNFGSAVGKAVSGRKIQDVSTIETSLQQYKVDKNYYPRADEYSPTNLWGYNSGSQSTPSNKVVVTYDGEAIDTLNGTLSIGGGIINGSGSLGQIGAKGTISQETLGKKYLTKDLYDPEIGDIKIQSSSDKMIDYGVGRYVYSIYKKSANWPNNQSGVAYNIAYTIKEENSDKYVTKIVGDYDEESCYDDKDSCPETLIGTLSGATINTVLKDGDEISDTNNSNTDNYGIPYAVTDFAQQ